MRNVLLTLLAVGVVAAIAFAVVTPSYVRLATTTGKADTTCVWAQAFSGDSTSATKRFSWFTVRGGAYRVFCFTTLSGMRGDSLILDDVSDADTYSNYITISVDSMKALWWKGQLIDSSSVQGLRALQAGWVFSIGLRTKHTLNTGQTILTEQ